MINYGSTAVAITVLIVHIIQGLVQKTDISFLAFLPCIWASGSMSPLKGMAILIVGTHFEVLPFYLLLAGCSLSLLGVS